MSRNIALIGLGAIGRSLATRLAAGNDAPQVREVLVRPGRSQSLAGVPSEGIILHEDVDSLCRARPDLVVECAGHGAVREHLPPLLESGIEVLVASIGALGDAALRDRLERAATRGGTRIRLCAGAVGGIDALTAARLAGLDEVTYTSRKPPAAFRGSPADRIVDLDSLTAAHLLFEGSADTAAREYPKNANVAMTVALAGVGPERTRVRIYADPAVAANTHEITASGAFGNLRLRLENAASPDNPRTSFLTVLSLEREIRSDVATIMI